ncbi:MAG: molybdopterin-dependent oxidoreductase [Thermoplasmata archaeon]
MQEEESASSKGITRRNFLAVVPAAAASILAARYLPRELVNLTYVDPIDSTLNPLETYPNRDWEQIYRNIYEPDSTFHYLCAPNDTHGCLLRASVKNGIVRYVDPSFGYNQATDLYGSKASARWDPRICPNGHAYVRRAYSDRRVKGAYVRQGFMDWVNAGMPRLLDGQPPAQYFENRGKETWLNVPWEQAFGLVAAVMADIARTYSGPEGTQRLTDQGYDPAMVAEVDGVGVRTLKHRASMAWLSTLRFTGLERFANGTALLDAWIRGVPAAEAHGARTWDSYAWHTDLPPGHPMVTGNKTSDFDLYSAEHSDLITTWGMNWIATKMPEGHWLTEARLRGARVIVIATEYQSTANKGDEVIVIRPATDSAFALGVAHVLMRDSLYDAAFVKRFTDLPLLVRLDTRKLLRASDVFSGYTLANLTNYVQMLGPGESPPSFPDQGMQYLTQEQRQEWGDFVVWDAGTSGPSALTRDHVGSVFDAQGVDPALEGSFQVTLADGTTTVECRPLFDLMKQYVMENFDPATASEICWAPVSAIESFAQAIAQHGGKTLFTVGMGPNHYWNNDLKDRLIFLLAGLTGSEGRFGGQVGSYAGNYRLEVFNGVGQWVIEDPFNLQLDPAQPAVLKKYKEDESAHFYNYGDRPLRVEGNLFTGSTHMPTPTKSAWWVNGNSILGNAKWAHDVIANTLPKMEMIVVNDWFWTATCEYADVVFGVPSWIERKLPDLYGACTNPFLQAVVPSPLPYIFDVKDDLEVYMGVAEELAKLTGDNRFSDQWKWVRDGRMDVPGQRMIDASNALKGYDFNEVVASCGTGVPFYVMVRTSPRITGWEQTNESKPWYTKTGRLEFYREEDEFLDAGENLPIWRETVDATYHEPAVIVSKPHPVIQPRGPADYGIDPADLRSETRQVRNVVKPWSEVRTTKHPLEAADPDYRFILYTPKYRHACHSMALSQDISAVYFGPFGDFYRHDKRMPYVGEGYVDMNPLDARDLGIEDGDYIWVDGDPSDRPFRGWQGRPGDFKVMRWLVRARYYLGMPRRTARAWFHMFIATHGSVEGHETRPDGLAKSPRTGYQAGYRYGSHQSITRAWLKPTLLTDSLVRKDGTGQTFGTGFAKDVHGATGAPKESFVKITKAEAGGIGGIGLWRPAALGFRPTYENDAVLRYMRGEYHQGGG